MVLEPGAAVNEDACPVASLGTYPVLSTDFLLKPGQKRVSNSERNLAPAKYLLLQRISPEGRGKATTTVGITQLQEGNPGARRLEGGFTLIFEGAMTDCFWATGHFFARLLFHESHQAYQV